MCLTDGTNKIFLACGLPLGSKNWNGREDCIDQIKYAVITKHFSMALHVQTCTLNKTLKSSMYTKNKIKNNTTILLYDTADFHYDYYGQSCHV